MGQKTNVGEVKGSSWPKPGQRTCQWEARRASAHLPQCIRPCSQQGWHGGDDRLIACLPHPPDASLPTNVVQRPCGERALRGSWLRPPVGLWTWYQLIRFLQKEVLISQEHQGCLTHAVAIIYICFFAIMSLFFFFVDEVASCQPSLPPLRLPVVKHEQLLFKFIL